MSYKIKSYQETFDEKGELQRVRGSLMLNGMEFVFSLNRQKSGKYLFRGWIKPVSIKDGFYLQIQGEKKRKKQSKMEKIPTGTHPQEFVASKDLYTNSTSSNEIEAYLLKQAEALYADNLLTINDELPKSNADGLKLSLMVHTHGRKFVSNRKLGAETVKKKLKDLDRAAVALDKYSMEKIPDSALISFHKSLDPTTANRVFRLTCEFWDYLLGLGLITCVNPFYKFYMSNTKRLRAAPDVVKERALKPQSLPEDVEIKLIQEICNEVPEDVKTTGLLMVSGVGISPTLACQIKWSDILFGALPFDFVTAQIKLTKLFLGSGTHDYLRPCTPWCANQLYRRYAQLSAQFGDISDQLILFDNVSGKNLDSKKLTAYCRERLIMNGMSYALLKADDSKPYGIGVSLLLANYRYKVSYIAGFAEDAGVVGFLVGRSLSGNVTADRYRSFTDLDGQYYLQKVLNRADNTLPPIPEPLTVSEELGVTIINAVSKDPSRFTHLRGNVCLDTGQYIELESDDMFEILILGKKPQWAVLPPL